MSSENQTSSGLESAVARSSGVGAGVLPAPERSPLAEMLRIAMPTVLGMLSYTIMQFVDKYFCAQLGVEELAAAGNGGVAAWFPCSVMAALLGVVNTFVSQNLGAGTPEKGSAYAWTGLWMSLVAWVVVLLPYAFWLPEVFASMRWLFGLGEVSAKVAELESGYARVLMVGMVITLWARGVAQFFYGMHRPVVVTVGVVLGNIVNFVLTYALVFGKWGLPEWGVVGSAVGTVIGTMVELAVPMAVFLSAKFNTLYGTRRAWRPSMSAVRDITRVGWPAGMMFGNEMVCWWIFMSGFVAQFGAAHNAASWITLQYMHLSFMPAVGMSIAVQAMVGKAIGAGDPDLARARARLGTWVTIAYMGACALVMVVFRVPLVELFVNHAPAGGASELSNADPELVLMIGGQLLILAAVFQMFDAVGITMIGALRGAGDTLWPGVMTVVLAWGLIIGGGKLITELRPEWGALGPWIGAAAYIIAFALAMAWRWKSGKWRSMKIVESAGGDGGATVAAH
ncbi:MAG: MATE family efflux transporter [Phycisphaerales bacterium]